MAFSQDYFGKVSTSANNQALRVWTYNGTATGSNEAIATLAAAGYFNTLQQNLTSGTEAGVLAVGDVIHLHGNDASGMYIVSSITTNVTIGSYAAIGTVNTANIADDAVTSAKINEDVIQYTTVAISAAAFNGMHVTPIELVAAGGADTMLVLEQVQLLMTYNSAAYAAGGVAHVQYDSTTLGAGVIASTTLAAATFQATASEMWTFNPGVVAQPFSTAVNKGLYLSNITGAFTTGDSTMVAHVWYRQIPTV